MNHKTESLSGEEQARYLRHLLLDDIGELGQLKLKNSSVLCVGAGGLASSALLYLAAAGVGKIGIIDFDTVDSSNLQRQVLFNTSDVGSAKAETAKKKLLELNPLIQVEAIKERFEAANAEKILSGYEAVIDATDNFTTRYLINDVAIKQKKPNFFGCVFKFTGQMAVFTAETGCYRCLFPAPPILELAPDCAQAGVFGVLPGIVGTQQALEFLKWKLGIGTLLMAKMLTIDALTNRYRTLSYAKNKNCLCAHPEKILLQSSDVSVDEISVQELNEKIKKHEKFVLIDVREKAEHQTGNLGGLLIPLGELSTKTELLPKERDQLIVIHCRSGGRSSKAWKILRDLGYTKVLNLTGGVLAWQREVDASLKV